MTIFCFGIPNSSSIPLLGMLSLLPNVPTPAPRKCLGVSSTFYTDGDPSSGSRSAYIGLLLSVRTFHYYLLYCTPLLGH